MSRHWKISTGRHFQNGHHNTAKIQHCPISSKFDSPELIPDIEKFLPVANFKMAATIPQKFNIVRYHQFDMWVDNDVPNWFPTLKNFYQSPFSKWPPQYHTNSTLSNFNAIWYVGRLWSPELIPDIEKFLQYRTNSTLSDFNQIDSWYRKISTGRHFQNDHHNTAQIQHCSISTSWIDSRHRKFSTGLHFQNGHHNTAKIQHSSISKVAFDLFFKPVVSGRFGRLHNR